MDTKTGEIYSITAAEMLATEQELGRELMPLTQAEAQQMKPLTLSQRVEWARCRKAEKRERRARNKRQRQARKAHRKAAS